MDGEILGTAIRALADADGADAILNIPGVWEIVADYYNNDAISAVLNGHHGDVCDECNEYIPSEGVDARCVVNEWHDESCSCYAEGKS